jgi:serine/threonine-protein kinase
MLALTIGNYRVVRQLGEGGMGVVYEAEHQTMGRRAAIKVLRAELVRDQEVIRRFFNEARATNEIRHSGIVQIYDCGTTADGAPWLIMELLQGENLSARIRRLGRLHAAGAVEIAAQTTSVLGAAHDAGIIHRDLKPDNLFIVRDPDLASGERVKVLDFGIAKLGIAGGGGSGGGASLRTRTGMLMGTPVYMSPEQCRGTKQVDGRSDIYSLGIIIYEMLAGEPPFMSEGVGELFDGHMNQPVPPLSAKNAAVPAALAGVVHKALAKSPGDRFQTMAELQRALTAPAAVSTEAARAAAPSRTPVAVPVSGAGAGARAGASPEVGVTPTTGTKVLPTPAPVGRTTLSASTRELDKPARAGGARAVPLAIGGALAVGIVAAVLGLRGSPPAPPAERPPAAAAPVAAAATAGGAAPAAAPAAAPVRPAAGTAAAAAAAPAPAPAPAPAASVTIDITTTPPEARVVDARDGKLLGTTPFRRELPAGGEDLKVVIERKGYLRKTVLIPGGRDFRATFKLDRAPAAAGAGTSTETGGEKIIKL